MKGVRKINLYHSEYLINQYSIKKYNENTYKMIYFKFPLKNPGFESDRKRLIPSRDINDEKLENNVSRAKNKIYEYALCNEFDYFITLTLDPEKYNRHDLKKYIKDLGQFIRDQRKKYSADIQYILIPEPHKDGAWHMHGLIKGINRNQLIKNKNGYLDWQDYSRKFGYCSIDYVKCQEAISKYITKYVSKALDVDLKREKEKKLYYCSRGLKKALNVEKGTLESSKLSRIPFSYENEYMKILDLDGLQYLRLQNDLSK